MPLTHIRCRRCRLVKPVADFPSSTRPQHEEIPRRKCWQCVRAKGKDRIWRRRGVRNETGLPFTSSDYERLNTGRCWNCGRGPGRRALHVDHDHETGFFRAILCFPCNVKMGK